MLTHLSLFSGVGGLDLAAEAAGFDTVGQCEWADYPTKVLEKHWPDVPRWRDIRTLGGDSFYEATGLRTVDVISGGFPCQPFSCAGKRRGKEDDRYLWPEMLRVIQEIRPTWCVGENVAGIVSMALDQVLSDMESQGYETRAFIIPACAIDAQHRRDRCAIIAHTKSQQDRRLQQSELQPDSRAKSKGNVAHRHGLGLEAPRAEQPTAGIAGGGENVADSEMRREPREFTERSQTWRFSGSSRGPIKPGVGRVVDGFPAWLDGVVSGVFPGEPDIPRIACGVKERVNRLKCLGNAVVPAQFYPVFRAIAEIEAPYYGEIGANYGETDL